MSYDGHNSPIFNIQPLLSTITTVTKVVLKEEIQKNARK